MSINVKTKHRAQAPIENRILRMRDLRERFGGISASHIYAMVASGRFPKPFPIIPGGRATGWFESTIDAYLTNGASTAALAEPEPDAIARAVEAEREACARVCDGYKEYGDPITNWALDCAAAIRARGSE